METLTRNFVAGAGTSIAAWQHCARLATTPTVCAAELVPDGARAVIVAPHPDDEILAAGGLMSQLALLGRDILLIAVTNGEASHPRSSIWPAARLAELRPRETLNALRVMRLEHLQIVRAGIPDGQVVRHEDELVRLLARELHISDVVFATWRLDGHPDHEAVGRASAAAARQIGATLVEVPVWGWHWAHPEDDAVPWQKLRRLPLDAMTMSCKRRAMQAYRSQLLPDASTGRGPVVPPVALEQLLRDEEIFIVGQST